MNYSQTTGIVLHSMNYGEADTMSVILTKKSGKQKFLFKGMKKSRKRSHTSTEPGSIVHLGYYSKHNPDYLIAREFSLEKYYPSLRNSLQHLYTMFYILELTEKTTGYSQEDENLYNLLTRAMESLSETKKPLLLLLQFQLQLMKLHGIMPHFDRCSLCSRPLTGFHANSQLTITCRDCSSSDTFFFTPPQHKLIQKSIRTNHRNLIEKQIDDNDLYRVNFYIALILEHYHTIQLKSKEILFEKKQIKT